MCKSCRHFTYFLCCNPLQAFVISSSISWCTAGTGPSTPITPVLGSDLPPPSSPAPRSIASISSLGKCKFSALTPNSVIGTPESQSLSPHPSPGASQAGTRQSCRPTNSELLHAKLDNFNVNIRAQMIQKQVLTQASLNNTKNARINKAKQLAMRQDKSWLGNDRLVALWDILNNVHEADSYLMINDEELQKTWVRIKLVQSDWPDSNW